MLPLFNLFDRYQRKHGKNCKSRSRRSTFRATLRRASLAIENLEHRHLLAGVPVLVDDLNTTTNGDQIGIQSSVTIAGVTYFAADDGVHGLELWRSNGTELGTRMVKDLNRSISNVGQSPASSNPLDLVNFDGTLYFTSQDSTNRQLYRSNGTAVGTQAVTGLPSNLNTNSIGGLTTVAGKVYFTATEIGSTIRRLWVTDGVTTQPLTDLNSTAGTIVSSLQFSLYNVNEKLIFFGNNGAGGIELWVSDGTYANTAQLTHFNPSQSFVNTFNGVTDKLLVQGTPGTDRLYFVGRVSNGAHSLWMTDGSLAGTEPLAAVIPSEMANVDGTLYFQAQSSGLGAELWRSNGTAAGTQLVADIATGSTSSFPQFIVGVGGTTYFKSRTSQGGEHSYWKTDGTTVEPALLPSSAGRMTVLGNELFFQADDPVLGRELFKIDASGTVSTFDLAPGAASSNPRGLTDIGGKLMFVASSGSAFGSLWSTQGDIASTKLIKDINQTTQNSALSTLIELNGQVYFSLNNEDELYTTDGTPAGTTQVTNIRPGEGSTNITEITRVGNALYFTAFDASGLRNLWKYDGNSAALVTDQVEPSGLREFNGRLYFSGHSRSVIGRVDLWRSDGTPAGTYPLGFNATEGGFVGEINGELFLRGNTGSGQELWRSQNPELLGFRRFSDDLVGTGITNSFFSPIESGGHLYFMADHPSLGRQLWVQVNGQGTPVVLTSQATIGNSTSVDSMIDVAGTLYFHTVTNNGNGQELWKTNGSVTGTQLIAVLDDGEYAPLHDLVVVDGRYYFTLASEINPEGGTFTTALWSSDGTAAGTSIVDTVPPPLNYVGDLVRGLRSSSGILYYQRYDAATGFELWSHNGLASTLVADISPGPASSEPFVHEVAGQTYIHATTPDLGRELWHLLDDSNPATQPNLAISDGVSGTIEIARIGDDLVVSKDGLELASYALGTIVGLTIQGDAESEVFIVDIDGLTSAVLPYGITIAAGEGVVDNDTLILSGSRTVSNYNYTTGGPESGTITLDRFTVSFTEFEPIIDHLNVVNRSFEIGTTGDQHIILEADGDAGTLLNDGGLGTFESLSFASSSGTFRIVSGSGNDTIVVRDLDATFAAELSIDGGAGNDQLDASEYDLSVALLGGPGNDVLRGGTSDDLLDGGDGDDLLDGGLGSDAMDGGAGTDNLIANTDDGVATIGEDGILELVSTFTAPVSATINWGDGTSIEPALIDPSSGKISGIHVYLYAGIYQVTLTATDGIGSTATKTISVNVKELIAGNGQVLVNSIGILRIGGTSADDQIDVELIGGNLAVTINGNLVRNDVPLTQVSEIRAWGHAGNDRIRLIDLAIISMLDGGTGDDELQGGRGDDLLLGGAGNDLLTGSAGDDFLIGGLGFDRLIGSQGHDILAAGDVDPILTRDKLRGISANWVAGKLVDNGLVDDTDNSSSNETGFDRLTGGSGADWFIVGAFDFITDYKKKNNEGDVVTVR